VPSFNLNPYLWGQAPEKGRGIHLGARRKVAALVEQGLRRK